ncbi:MAG: serine/threonine-protein kinase [Planctomycetota bacterium]|nr:MAG: serine/threonine-protein kinase [Planctomycetota bacterium]
MSDPEPPRDAPRAAGDLPAGVLEVLARLTGAVAQVSLRATPMEAGSGPVTAAETPGTLPAVRSSFTVLGEIGRGGMGAVLRGHDGDLGRDVAIKVLHPELAAQPEVVARFIEEAQIGGQLQHPGIVPVYQLGLMADQRPYFAMKLVRGRTLAALLAARESVEQDRRRLLDVFEAVCQTLAYAHSRGVIHRDLKPDNVMVGAFGEVQVVDWGLAKVLGSDTARPPQRRAGGEPEAVATVRTAPGSEGSHSLAGAMIGTPAYMPPEQARGAVEALDERSDVFSLGAILCEILTGDPPYRAGPGRHPALLALKAELGDALARLDACGGDPELIAMCRECLAADPQARPRSAEVLAERVRAYLTSVEERAERARLEAAAAAVKAEGERKARRLTLALAGAVLAALVLGGGAWLRVQNERAQRVAEAERAVAQTLEEALGLQGRAQAAGTDLSLWREALGAGRRARELALDGAAGSAARARASSLVAALEEQQRRAQARVQQQDLDRATLEALVETRQEQGVLVDPEQTEQHYAEAFRAYGIDPEQGPASEARIRDSAVAEELLVALNDWLFVREQAERPLEPLQRLLDQADPDPWRASLRAAETLGALAELRAQLGGTATPSQLIALAERLGQAGDPAGAVALAGAAQRLAPGDFWAHWTTGYWAGLMQPPQLEVAARAYTASVALQPRSYAVWNNLGATLYKLRDLEGAAAASREATRLRPTGADARFNLGIALRDRGQFEAGIAELREAVRLKPEEAEFHNALAAALAMSGDAEAAVAECREALRLRPDYVAAQVVLGIALRNSGDLDGAEAALREALRLQPDSVEAHANLGGLLLGMPGADLNDAVAEFREALRLSPQALNIHYQLGVALEALGDWAGAAEAYGRELERQPDVAEFWLLLAMAQHHLGRPEEARRSYERALELLDAGGSEEDEQLRREAEALLGGG